nr:hypothetical protein Itr_chr12CG31900 [Ipomoea trifida]
MALNRRHINVTYHCRDWIRGMRMNLVRTGAYLSFYNYKNSWGNTTDADCRVLLLFVWPTRTVGPTLAVGIYHRTVAMCTAPPPANPSLFVHVVEI